MTALREYLLQCIGTLHTPCFFGRRGLNSFSTSPLGAAS